ncbi:MULTISPECIES: ABC transporter permease [Bacillus]|uniref:ABC transporter permease n=1 Tax=Bacillus TaxID=1386 RepID=UPI0005A32608|nr:MULTISPECIES: ABC transporter permease [Bacillus]AJH25807.1 hypothetical protein SB45_17525 [Bacillus velezensis]AKD23926.1 hypothetical protein XM40_17550 [Bacillus velezensis]KZE59961.1 hypothetical protein AV542_02680 [Bacillus amyloliquefaciens]MCQ9150031.1 ABC transporter permease [Bacillus amyloliquefaciens]MDH3085102.1 ABC transporter permease [Bacillus velezensis]
MKLKIPLVNIFLFLSILTSIIILITYLNFNLDKKIMNKLSNNFYSDQSVHFVIKENKHTTDDFEKLFKKKIGNFNLFKEISDTKNKVFGFYSNGNIDKPSMKKGRFLSEKDYFKKKLKAVVGQNVKVKKKNGVQCFVYHSKCIEVIGVMGYDFKSKIDDIVYINIDGINNISDDISGMYVLDDISFNKEMFSHVKEKANELEISFLNAKFNNLTNKLGMDNNLTVIITLLLFIFIIKHNILLYFWIYKKRIVIAINYVIGYSLKKIYFKSFVNFFISMTLSYIIAFFLVSLFEIKNILNQFWYYFYYISLLYSLVTTLSCIAFFISWKISSNGKILRVLK